MPIKHYRLKLEHPYANKGTIVEEDNRDLVRIEMKFPGRDGYKYHTFPLETLDTWLEEVKEEPTCSKEFADRMKARLQEMSNIGEKDVVIWRKWLVCWIDEHTSKEE